MSDPRCSRMASTLVEHTMALLDILVSAQGMISRQIKQVDANTSDVQLRAIASNVKIMADVADRHIKEVTNELRDRATAVDARLGSEMTVNTAVRTLKAFHYVEEGASGEQRRIHRDELCYCSSCVLGRAGSGSEPQVPKRKRPRPSNESANWNSSGQQWDTQW